MKFEYSHEEIWQMYICTKFILDERSKLLPYDKKTELLELIVGKLIMEIR